MSVSPWPDHLLSLDEWAALPEDNTHHYELVDGVLQVSPRPASDHQWAIQELGYQLRDQVPADLRALPKVEVVLTAQWPTTVRSPDLVVVPKRVAVTNPARYSAAEVLLAVEVVSPGSRKIDHGAKMYDYSEAGIPSYWILDIETPVTLTAHRLVDGEYEVVGDGTDVLALSEPAPVTVDVAGLLPHRA
jgi:Uma2 family endonuclease